MPLIPKNQPPYYTTENKIKKYVVLLEQSGTTAPVATILENTLGGLPVFAYVSPGTYTITLTGAFPTGRTTWIIGNTAAFVYILAQDANEITFASESPAGTPQNDQLFDTTLEITVYPT